MPRPPSDSLQESSTGTAAGRQLIVGLATLLGVFLCVFGPGVLTSIRMISGNTGPPASHAWGDRVAALEWDVFATAVVLIVVVRWLPRHAPLVTRRMGLGGRLTHWVPAGLLGAAAGYVAVAVVSSWAGDHLVTHWQLARGTYTQLGQGTGSFVVTSGAAAAAGFTEETTLVALAAAVVEQACHARGRRPRWTITATITALIVLRWLIHLYYLWGSVFVVAWAPGAYLLYRWVGSVWPLIVGHWLYDGLALAARVYPRVSRPLDTTLWVLAACGVVAIAVSLGRHLVWSVPMTRGTRRRRRAAVGSLAVNDQLRDQPDAAGHHQDDAHGVDVEPMCVVQPDGKGEYGADRQQDDRTTDSHISLLT